MYSEYMLMQHAACQHLGLSASPEKDSFIQVERMRERERKKDIQRKRGRGREREAYRDRPRDRGIHTQISRKSMLAIGECCAGRTGNTISSQLRHVARRAKFAMRIVHCFKLEAAVQDVGRTVITKAQLSSSISCYIPPPALHSGLHLSSHNGHSSTSIAVMTVLWQPDNQQNDTGGQNINMNISQDTSAQS
jgi:hypothetical protein